MRPLTSQFSASVRRRDQVVKNTWVGRGAANSGGDRIGVFEVGGQRSIRLVEPARVAAEPGDVPAVVE